MRLYFLWPLLLQKLIWIPTRFLLRFFGHLDIKGLENLNNVKGPVIFACNHSSEADVFFVPASLPFFSRFSPIFYVSREKAFYSRSGWKQLFYGGTFFKAWGSYPVIVGLHDYDKSLANHKEIIGDGGSICIFPEGKCTLDGNIQEAKGGVSYLAYATKTPIVPVKIVGTFHMTVKDFFQRRKYLAIHYGPPIIADEIASDSQGLPDYKKYAQGVMDKVRSA